MAVLGSLWSREKQRDQGWRELLGVFLYFPYAVRCERGPLAGRAGKGKGMHKEKCDLNWE